MKVLILSCSTGGGHNAAAYALKEQFCKRNIECDVKEFLSIINMKICKVVNKTYIKSTTGNGRCFKCVYKLGELYEKTRITSPVYGLNSLTKKKLYKYIVDNNYTYVVATHLFPAQALTAIKKKYNVKFCVICTDYVSIPFWEETDPDYYIIPHKELIPNFTSKKICLSKLIPMGIPVSDNYSRDVDTGNIKKELNLPVNKKYILVMSGSMGFGRVEQIVQKLDNNLSEEYIIIAACGNNLALKDKMEKEFPKERVIALSYTNEIYKYIRISEMVLSKPGGLSTTEICTANIPLIHTMPIPGCETKNADFFSSNNMSIKCDSIEEILEAVNNIANNETLRNSMIASQNENIDRYAASKICEYIIGSSENDVWENEHTSKNWNLFNVKIDKSYKYVRKDTIFKIFSSILFYVIAVPVIYLLTKIKYNFKVKGKENFRNVQGNGVVSVSNHIACLDCAMMGVALSPYRLYYATLEQNFSIPVVRHLVKLLNGIPIPSGIENKRIFVTEVGKLLQDNKMIQIYPEAALKPFCNKIRNFKDGAFNIAIRNNVPILPMVFVYKKPTGIRKLFKRKPDLVLEILPAIYPNKNKNFGVEVKKIKEEVRQKMVETFTSDSNYSG